MQKIVLMRIIAAAGKSGDGDAIYLDRYTIQNGRMVSFNKLEN
jgi:hypothetical protein